jgi:DNA-binding transcriptional ArsR family regulator
MSDNPPENSSHENEKSQKIIHDLIERKKELACLYALSEIIGNSENLDVFFTNIVKILPPAYQYPDITCARISFNNNDYKTDNFEESKWKQSADIMNNNEKHGTIDVFYLEQKKDEVEGPFLQEERYLIDNIANQISRAVENFIAEQTFRQISKLIVKDNQIPYKTENKQINRTEIDKIEKKQQLTNFLESIANKERIIIVDLLRERALSVSELGEILDKSHSTISHHLKILENLSIIKGWKEGKFNKYSLVRSKVMEYMSLFQNWIESTKNWFQLIE